MGQEFLTQETLMLKQMPSLLWTTMLSFMWIFFSSHMCTYKCLSVGKRENHLFSGKWCEHRVLEHAGSRYYWHLCIKCRLYIERRQSKHYIAARCILSAMCYMSVFPFSKKSIAVFYLNIYKVRNWHESFAWKQNNSKVHIVFGSGLWSGSILDIYFCSFGIAVIWEVCLIQNKMYPMLHLQFIIHFLLIMSNNLKS